MKEFISKFKQQKPFYEVWWGKVGIDKEQAFWWRYTINHGVKQMASVWAILFDGKKIFTAKENFPLADLVINDQNNIFVVPNNQLTFQSAQGKIKNIKWNLNWLDHEKSHFFEPWYIQKLSLAKSHYISSLMDLTIQGEIIKDQQKILIKNKKGVMGHIYGSKMAEAWFWIHANDFDKNVPVVFEGLMSKIKLGFFNTPYLSQFVIYYQNKKIIFDSPINLFFSKINFKKNIFTFETSNKNYLLKGEVTSHPDQTAIVEYTDPDDSKRYCHNSKLAHLKLGLVDKKNHHLEEFFSHHQVSFEFVTRKKPFGKIHL